MDNEDAILRGLEVVQDLRNVKDACGLNATRSRVDFRLTLAGSPILQWMNCPNASFSQPKL